MALSFVWTALYTLFIEFGGEYGYARGLPAPFAVGVGMMVLGAAGMAAAKGIAAYRERQAWIQRMRQQDEEKRKAKSQQK